ncbi:MAG TPA: hypothetical protein PKL77_06110 [Candidatus Omnitrophota bacterium]|nr:hypothetical protein [Candidatus Omnitrophota bacterium]
MKKANQDIRNAAKAASVPLWAIAEKQGKGELSLIRKLRHELSEEEKSAILKIIADLK